MTRALAAFAALALVLPVAASAQAPPTNAPPGNSAIDEYLETVPGATGPVRPRPPSSNGASGGGALTPAQRDRLRRLGPDGRTLADAIDATSPPRTAVPAQPAPGDGSAPKARSAQKGERAAEGRSPLREVAGALGGGDDGGGMGLALPAVLVATLLAALAVVVARRRATS